MIKTLSLLIATSALTISAFATEKISIKEQRVSRCKKSDRSQGNYLIKECSKKLSFNDRIVISGSDFKESRRLELLILDKRGANYYMADGVKNSSFEPSGKIEIIKTDGSDKAVIYKLNYSSFDSEDSYFRIVTVRLKGDLKNSRKTCIVAISDSQDSKVKLTDSAEAKSLEKNLRGQSKDFVLSNDFRKAKCSQYVHSH